MAHIGLRNHGNRTVVNLGLRNQGNRTVWRVWRNAREKAAKRRRVRSDAAHGQAAASPEVSRRSGARVEPNSCRFLSCFPLALLGIITWEVSISTGTGRAYSPRCSIQMPKIFLRNDLKNLHKCINKKHPEQVKTDLTNLKVFWTFRRLDCTNSKGFQPSEEIEKDYSTCVTPRYLHRQYSKAYTLISSLLWISTEHNQRLLL